MNVGLLGLEMAVIALGLGLLLLDLWVNETVRAKLGYGAAACLGLILLLSFTDTFAPGVGESWYAFGGLFVQDGISLFFKRIFLVVGVLVLILAVDFSERLETAVSEYYALIVFALGGMMLAASANNLLLMFIAIELITVTFYVLTGYRRNHLESLEAGLKYLVLGALSSGLMVFGIAFVFGVSGELSFQGLSAVAPGLGDSRLYQVGLLLVLAGLAFKVGVVPMHFWVPDVYQGAPTPTTAFLATGSKAAGFVLVIRFLFAALPDLNVSVSTVILGLACLTILYGNLCAMPQRNLKRLLGYSGIGHAGYLLLGIGALSAAGVAAVLFYLATYLFALLGAFMVISIVSRSGRGEDLEGISGLARREPFLAGVLTSAVISLAGIPLMAGFFGKFLILKAVIQQGENAAIFYWATGVAILGIVISFCYYFNLLRTIYWSRTQDTEGASQSCPVTAPLRLGLGACLIAVFFFGLFPGRLWHAAEQAVQVLHRL